ncbi:hypothetical protein Sme01_09830 [Sphaerisporangium melleum]|uniref:Uncharacterized protein n=1 Tax=Sphaerisporangium melleum TaxID=321316 RepID=A0A917QTY0_9ACTN|nr:hypothetical protein GCM10007964_07780 [Sphaerisporangium melleum]GII68507.1 hypothetical protein Sme01_09830 [Sphaerisporangium melleum]
MRGRGRTGRTAHVDTSLDLAGARSDVHALDRVVTAGGPPAGQAGRARVKPINFTKRTDVIVVPGEPAARAGWVKVSTPKDAPGFQWMLTRQLGHRRQC